MKFVKDDGGRSKYFKGIANDCVCRAIAIGLNRDYKEVYDLINEYAKKEHETNPNSNDNARYGVSKELTNKILTDLGWEWKPTMQFGKGCTTHLKDGELPKKGTLIVSVSKHLTVVKDGVIYDNFNPSREGTRCVYGFFQKSKGKA